MRARTAAVAVLLCASAAAVDATPSPTPRAPYRQPWPEVHRREQVLMQPLVQMFVGDRLTGAARHKTREVCADERNTGSANQAGFAVAVRYGARLRRECGGDLDLARSAAEDFFVSQLERDGLMAPWGRDETLAQGYGDLHLAIAAALVRFAEQDPEGERLQRLAVRWLRGWVAVHTLAEEPKGDIFLPSARAGGGSLLVSQAALHLLTGRTWRRRGELFYRRLNRAGVPANTGPFMLRELIRAGGLRAPLLVNVADLPKLRHELHIVRSTRGIVSWMVGLETGGGDSLLQPVAGSLDGRQIGEPVWRQDVDDRDWPSSAGPGFRVPGRVLEHWRGGPRGWKRLDAGTRGVLEARAG